MLHSIFSWASTAMLSSISCSAPVAPTYSGVSVDDQLLPCHAFDRLRSPSFTEALPIFAYAQMTLSCLTPHMADFYGKMPAPKEAHQIEG